VNPTKIAVAGGSAGGYLALMVGLSDDKTGPGGDPKATVSAQVAAVIDMYGVVNFSKHGKGDVPGVDAAQQAAHLPEQQADRKDPPVSILHGTADTTVDIQQSKDIAAALAKAYVPYDLIIVDGAPHTFDLHPKASGWGPTALALAGQRQGDAQRDKERPRRPCRADLGFPGSNDREVIRRPAWHRPCLRVAA